MAVTPTDLARGSTQEIGRRHGVPSEAVETLVEAIRQGGGQQAQFSHPALGGMGQWSRGGGIMIGDLFNHSLKAKVEQLCEDLARYGEEPSSDDWWPRDLGRPSSVGSQNDEAYAFFPEPRRLALRDANGVRLYETGDHRISGVSQQHGSSRDLVFISQHGMVRPADLQPVQKPLTSGSGPRAAAARTTRAGSSPTSERRARCRCPRLDRAPLRTPAERRADRGGIRGQEKRAALASLTRCRRSPKMRIASGRLRTGWFRPR